jgi:hypothetical protein
MKFHYKIALLKQKLFVKIFLQFLHHLNTITCYNKIQVSDQVIPEHYLPLIRKSQALTSPRGCFCVVCVFSLYPVLTVFRFIKNNSQFGYFYFIIGYISFRVLT